MPDLATPLIAWYRENARDLPWRRPGFGAWGVLVSEFMLQQTPVDRVIPHLEAWLDRLGAEPGAVGIARSLAAIGHHTVAGKLFERLGEPADAARAFEHAGVLERAADNYLRARLFADGARCLDAALGADPEHYRARLLLGRLLLEQGRTEAAVRALHANGINVLAIKDVTPIPHNGCRAPKPRRV